MTFAAGKQPAWRMRAARQIFRSLTAERGRPADNDRHRSRLRQSPASAPVHVSRTTSTTRRVRPLFLVAAAARHSCRSIRPWSSTTRLRRQSHRASAGLFFDIGPDTTDLQPPGAATAHARVAYNSSLANASLQRAHIRSARPTLTGSPFTRSTLFSGRALPQGPRGCCCAWVSMCQARHCQGHAARLLPGRECAAVGLRGGGAASSGFQLIAR